MKVAILIYGRLDKCMPQYHNIINNLQISNNEVLYIDFFCSSDNSGYIDEFLYKYKPKSYANDKINIDIKTLEYYKKFPKMDIVNVENVLYHFNNKKRVFNLFAEYCKKKDEKYDLVLCTRIDLNFYSKLPLNLPDINTIYIPEGQDWANGLNDQIAYGNYEVMEKYCDVINNIDLILQKKMSYAGFHPENFVLANLKLYQVNINRFKLDYKIVR